MEQALLWPEIGDIRGVAPSLLKANQENDRQEFDGFWSFQDLSLVIEAKRVGASFSHKQLSEYLDAFKTTKRMPLWLLAVGRGKMIFNSLKEITIPKNVNVLYIDWRTILAAILKNIQECPGAILQALLRRYCQVFEAEKS